MNETTQLSPAMAAFHDDCRYWANVARAKQAEREAQGEIETAPTDEQPPQAVEPAPTKPKTRRKKPNDLNP